MPQAIQIETQAKPQGLALLHRQRTTGRSCREFALHRREQALDQRATTIDPSWKLPPHLCTHSADEPGFLPCLAEITLWPPSCCRI